MVPGWKRANTIVLVDRARLNTERQIDGETSTAEIRCSDNTCRDSPVRLKLSCKKEEEKKKDMTMIIFVMCGVMQEGANLAAAVLVGFINWSAAS